MASPKRHLASVRPIEDVTFDSWCRLISLHNPIGAIFHEFGEIVHAANQYRTPQIVLANFKPMF
jgi:hypothetical protein